MASPSLKPLLATAAIAALALGLATPASAKGSTITKKAAGKQYLALVAPVNGSIGAFNTTASKWSKSTTIKQAEKDAKPVIKALQTLDRKLTADRWPSAAVSSVRGVTASTLPVIADLKNLAVVSVSGTSKWGAAFSRDLQNLSIAVDSVRSELGLPLAK